MNITRYAAIASLVALSACATNEFSGTRTEIPGAVLVNSSLYVYSFLDIRDSDFGSHMLAEFDKQLSAALEKRGVKSKVLPFKHSELGRGFSMSEYGTGRDSSGVNIPVKRTVSLNAADEKLLGAEYRLLVFPSQMTISGAWQFYDVRWDLVEVKSGRVFWTTTSHGKHLVGWNNDEQPESRAKTIVTGVLVEMEKSHLL